MSTSGSAYQNAGSQASGPRPAGRLNCLLGSDSCDHFMAGNCSHCCARVFCILGSHGSFKLWLSLALPSHEMNLALGSTHLDLKTGCQGPVHVPWPDPRPDGPSLGPGGVGKGGTPGGNTDGWWSGQARPVVSTLRAMVLAHCGRLTCLASKDAAEVRGEIGSSCGTRLLEPKAGFIPSLCRGCRTKSEAGECGQRGAGIIAANLVPFPVTDGLAKRKGRGPGGW